MNKSYVEILLILFCFYVNVFSKEADIKNTKQNDLKLWYSKPALKWTEALPLGNSRIGAMVYGGIEKEEIQLNEETFWAGSPYRNDNPEALKYLGEIRNLIFYNHNLKAQKLIDKTFYTKRNGMPYLTVGSLILTNKSIYTVTDYYRELDLNRAVASTMFNCDGVNYKREIFTSLVDNVLIIRLMSDKPGKLNFTVSYQSPVQKKVYTKGQKLVLVGKGIDHEGVKGCVEVETQTQAKVIGGKVRMNQTSIDIANADTVTLYVSIATNFVNYTSIKANASKRAAEYLSKALKVPYNEALNNHITAYQKQFNRVVLDIGNTKEAQKETTERIIHFNEGNDLSLAALLFQYGRYLLISSSQPGGQPSNLQGVWNNLLNDYPQ